MALASPLYALFLLVVLLVAAILKRDWVAPFLLVASLVFYATGDLNGIPYLIAVIAIAYCGGLSLGRAQSARRLWLWVALTLAPLLFFKYAAGTKVILWLAGRLPWVLPADGGFQPLGISFFTFQAIAYLIDVYRRQFPPERNVLRVGLFLSFFPLVLAGPIERAPP